MANDRSYMVFTAVGPDRPGLVNEISAAIHRAGANLEARRLAILGGELALILLLSCRLDAVERVKQFGGQLESELRLHCILKETRIPVATGNYLPYSIRVTGVDRPGIVQAIAGILA